MRLLSTRIRGLGPFRDEISLDLEALGDARLVAITGENGSGKSSLLELAIPGACYRSTPTRGSLKDLAVARDALLESTVETGGHRYTLRHLVDGVSGKGESVVLDETGAVLVESAKVSEFDSWAERHLLAPDILFASIFGAQQAGGFLSAKPAERKSLLLQILGIQRYEDLARAASEGARAATTQLEGLRARLEECRGEALDVARAAVTAAREELGAAEGQLALAREQLRLDEASRAEEEATALEARQARERRSELTQQLEQARAELSDLETRRQNNLGLTEQGDEIRDAAARIEGLRQQLAAASAEVTRIEGLHREHVTAGLSHARDRMATTERVARIQSQLRALESVLAGAAEVDAARARLPAERQRHTETEAQVATALESLRQMQGQQLAGADERIVSLRGGLLSVTESVVLSCHPTGDRYELGAIETARMTLHADDAAQSAAEQYPEQKRLAEEAYKTADAARIRAHRELTELERIAAREGEISAARSQLEGLQGQLETELGSELASVEAQTASVDAATDALTELTAARERASELELQAIDLDRLARRLPQLEQVAARLEELDVQIERASTTATALAAQLAGLVVPLVPEPRDLTVPRAAVEAAQRAVSDGSTRLALAERGLHHASEVEQRRAVLAVEIGAAETEAADWARLAEDLGKKGLQAAVIDAALPELVEIANDLLHAAFGPRFTIDVRTQAVNSTGKKLIETLDVIVIDTEAGREAAAETFSGGERVILSEALALALTTLACREHGIQRPTLIRDESGAALSAARAPQWIAMLRRAADLIGAGRVLFVSHDSATWELADVRIVVCGGKAWVQA